MAIKWNIPAPTEVKFSLSLELSKHIGGYEKERSHKTVHASDITKDDFCPREYILRDLTGKERKERYISPALKATFDQGNMTNTLVTENWAGEKAVGNWQCRRCDKWAEFCTRPKPGCGSSTACDWEYKEVAFHHPVADFVGNLDLLYAYNPIRMLAVEIKTVNPKDFEKIVAPLAEHRVRTQLYLRLIEESDNPRKHVINTQEARVLYVSRGHGMKNPEAKDQILPFRDFKVERDDPAVEPYLQRARVVRIARQENQVPSGICPTPMCSSAKSCEMIKECFSGKYPATM